jgi:hypothetical protein
MQVVFLVLVDSTDPAVVDKAIKKMIARSPALQIRGHLVAKWAIHLSQVRCRKVVITFNNYLLSYYWLRCMAILQQTPLFSRRIGI